jgi:signal transduction histidine kinase
MALDGENSGIALRCDMQGRILEILNDQAGLFDPVESGRLVTQYVERGSRAKMLSFLLTVQSEGAAFDWEINWAVDDRISTLSLAGIVVDTEIWLVGAQSSESLPRLFEELLQMGNEQTNIVRRLVKERSTVGRDSGQGDRSLYDEISRLNNDLVTLQRELTRKNAELGRYAADLDRRNEEIRQFAYIVSHDLKAPLINLKGFCAELASAVQVVANAMESVSPYLDEAQQQAVTVALEQNIPEALGFVHSSVERMSSFVGAVLKLARLGYRELEWEPVAMTPLVREILGSLLHQVDQQSIRITFKDLPEVIADRVSMEQVMGNLVTNAILYLDPQRPGEIEITAEHGVREVIFRIRDNGRGIAEADRKHVFAPFRRGGQQDVPGEGMGLAYVQTLIRRHGGRIWFDSVQGEGTTFLFSLPNQPRGETGG